MASICLLFTTLITKTIIEETKQPNGTGSWGENSHRPVLCDCCFEITEPRKCSVYDFQAEGKPKLISEACEKKTGQNNNNTVLYDP